MGRQYCEIHAGPIEACLFRDSYGIFKDVLLCFPVLSICRISGQLHKSLGVLPLECISVDIFRGRSGGTLYWTPTELGRCKSGTVSSITVTSMVGTYCERRRGHKIRCFCLCLSVTLLNCHCSTNNVAIKKPYKVKGSFKCVDYRGSFVVDFYFNFVEHQISLYTT